MKANRTNILKNDTGDVGIGTLIIFIAMVLVAAVAAAVLIQTSGVLQQKAQSTGKEAVSQVSSNINVVNVVGTRTSSSDITSLDVAVQISAGGSQIDFNQVIVKYISDAAGIVTLTNSDFTFTKERNPSETSTNVLASGDLGIINVTSITLAARKKATIQIIPETGSMVVKDVQAPNSFGTETRVQLFP